jgi:hypothetical protein
MLVLANVIKNIYNKNKENFKNKNNKKSILKTVWKIFYTITLLILMWVPAILISQQCNPNNKVGYGILAFLFPDMYIFQWSLKKFVRKVDGYCPMK